MEMKAKIIGYKNLRRLLSLSVCATLFSFPAFAQEEEAPSADPFAVKTESWTSLDSYTSGKPDEKKVLPAPPEAGGMPSVSAELPVMAVPERQLNLAPLPRMDVPAPEKEAASTDTQKIDYDNKPLDKPLAEGSWRDTAMVKHSGNYEDVSPLSSSVRYAVFPGIGSLTATPAGSATASNKSKEKALANAKSPDEVLQTPKEKIVTPPMSQAEKDACEAVNAYKKKQLAAIKSDSQTLSELRAAIAALGAQDKIDIGNVSNRLGTKVSTQTPTEGEKPPQDQKKK